MFIFDFVIRIYKRSNRLFVLNSLLVILSKAKLLENNRLCCWEISPSLELPIGWDVKPFNNVSLHSSLRKRWMKKRYKQYMR